MTNSIVVDIIFELFNDYIFEDYWDTSNLAEDISIIRGYIINLSSIFIIKNMFIYYIL